MKIVFVHPALMDYRVDIFNRLNDNYNTTFIFTKQGKGQENVKEEHQSIPDKWNSKILRTNIIIKKIDVGMQIKLFKEILFGDYKLVISSTSRYTCWFASKISGKKFMQMTEFWFWPNPSLSRRLLNELNRVMSRNSDSIFAMGSKSYNSYINLGVKSSRIFMYPQCALDYSQYPIENIRKSFGLQGYKVIMFLGRLVKTKGIEYLLEAFSKLQLDTDDVFLVIAGDGPSKEHLQFLANHLGINNICFVGAVSKTNIASFYNLCDLFVLPSIFTEQSYEPWGLVVNEAMAFGKPIVTTSAVGSGYDLIKNGYNGFVVEDKNVDELYLAIKNIILNDTLINQMGFRSRIRFLEINDINKFHNEIVKAIEFACNDL